jgi:pimeloyl-ACP methyl ester carboxylesterase
MPLHTPGLVLAGLMAAAVLTGCGGSSAPSGAPSPARALQGRLLSAADLPAGWSAVPPRPMSTQTDESCLSGLTASPAGYQHATAAFVEGTSIPSLGEVLAAGPQGQQGWQSLGRVLAGCRTATITIGKVKAAVTIQPLPFPRVGSTSSAYAWAFTIGGIRLGVDIVLFKAGTDTGYVTYADLGSPPVATVQAFADAAADKAATGSTARVSTDTITSTPVQTAHTKLGTVAYRTIGSGPALVLITGFSGTMDNWDPRFVDALAQHSRVVTFDNAGVGPTAALPMPLSIDAMASQTSALISALGLGRPDVLGWSMGSMIAQALAVLHPDQVNHLVLCASWPGNGQAVAPSQQTLNADTTGDLFPANQTSAQNTYLASISSYPAVPAVPAAIAAAQEHAIDQWWAGRDPAGMKDATITVPTLITDGTADLLDPVANSHTLASLIHGARLTLYPDAGHGFLFQDQTALIPRIESFVG